MRYCLDKQILDKQKFRQIEVWTNRGLVKQKFRQTEIVDTGFFSLNLSFLSKNKYLKCQKSDTLLIDNYIIDNIKIGIGHN